MPSNGSGSVGILGVLVGALIVAAFVLIVFGDRLGLSGDGTTTNVKIEAPKTPAPTPGPKTN
ncbi:MAG TPA: hypothetical protein VNK52_09340 [Hyphomicrobiaceae bacterium]|nr:hypothetical protein [Hyphomicrobiaceae bacterium]